MSTTKVQMTDQTTLQQQAEEEGEQETVPREKKRREAAQQADIEHKQSQLLFQHQDLLHRPPQPQAFFEDIEGQERRIS